MVAGSFSSPFILSGGRRIAQQDVTARGPIMRVYVSINWTGGDDERSERNVGPRRGRGRFRARGDRRLESATGGRRFLGPLVPAVRQAEPVAGAAGQRAPGRGGAGQGERR